MADALKLGMRCHREGNLNAAEQIYRAVLQAHPNNADALHFLGVLAHQRGDTQAGIELIRAAIAEAPLAYGVYNNLGNVLYEADRFEEAADAYAQANTLFPNADAYNNLGATLRVLKRFDEAEMAYTRALELNPEHVDAHNNFGNLLAGLGRITEAIDHFCTAMTHLPSHPEARRQLGVAYSALGRKEEAAAVYRQWLADEPENAVAAHMLAACSGESVPERASDSFVERVFDNFASNFDAKLAHLEYRAPELVAQALAKACGQPRGSMVALDAGCGTGLAGVLIAPYCSILTGVDLSARMMLKAKTRGIYNQLIKQELTEFLGKQQRRFDLIVSADTLVYFGALEAVLGAATQALAKNGWLIFSVERASEEAAGVAGHLLNAHGRYSHSESYLRRVLGAAGLAPRSLDPGVLRSEAGRPVEGLIVTAQREA